MDYIIIGCAALLFVSALMIIYRTAKGPTALDRMVSVDMLTSIVIGAFALLAAATRRADLLPVFVVLSIIGFIGSTTLARFAAPLTSATRKALAQAAAQREEARWKKITDDGDVAAAVAKLQDHTGEAEHGADILKFGALAAAGYQLNGKDVSVKQATDFLAKALMSFQESDVRANQKHVDGNEDRGERN